MANDTEFGLAASVRANDVNRSWRMIDALEYGIVGLDEGASSTEIGPSGGVRQSGIGREGSKYGVDDDRAIKIVDIGNMRQEA